MMATEREKEKAFAKTDMERVALFQEMGYICIGDKYKTGDSRVYFVASLCSFWIYHIHIFNKFSQVV